MTDVASNGTGEADLYASFGGMLDRLPVLGLDPGDQDPHITGSGFRSPTSLPVRFGT